MSRRLMTLAGLLLALTAAPASASHPLPEPRQVVVATFDTGTNPFHTCFRRPGHDHPHARNPLYPETSQALPLTFAQDYATSLEASKPALEATQKDTLYHVPGTNLSYFGPSNAWEGFIDRYPHGAQASSQIGCVEYGMAPDAQLVIVPAYGDAMGAREDMYEWVAAQPWIDIVHLNIQDTPIPGDDPGIAAMIASGKLVVIAAGNGVVGAAPSYPMELSHYNAPPGSLIAGANDNGGYAWYSNLNPHVVMDGLGTRAAAPRGDGSTSFGGTSSASPRITGYAARLLADLRARFGYGCRGLVSLPRAARPTQGPLADGLLLAAEMHEAIRKTADPNPHESRYDGAGELPPVPQPVDTPFAVYAKMGYGEVSEHTLPQTFAVLAGAAPLPARENEDRFYAVSEEMRRRVSGRPDPGDVTPATVKPDDCAVPVVAAPPAPVPELAFTFKAPRLRAKQLNRRRTIALVVGASRPVNGAEVSLKLGRRVVARARRTRLPGTVGLRRARRLRPGRYVLTVSAEGRRAAFAVRVR